MAMKLNRNLLWEVLRYLPEAIFILEPTSSRIKEKLLGDVAYFHFFLEDVFGCRHVRELTWNECWLFLYELIRKNPPYLMWLLGDQLILFDCEAAQVSGPHQILGLPQYSG